MTEEQQLVAAARCYLLAHGYTMPDGLTDDGDTRFGKAQAQLILLHKFHNQLHGLRELHDTQDVSYFARIENLEKIHQKLKALDFEKSFEALLCPGIDAAEHGIEYACYSLFRQ